MSRPSLVESQRGVVSPLNQCEPVVFLHQSHQPWSPTTPRCIMLMWLAAREVEKPPGSYRDQLMYKVLEYCQGISLIHSRYSYVLYCADPSEDMFTHYVPCLPLIKGHGGTCSRVINICFIWWKIYWVAGKPSLWMEKYLSTSILGLPGSFYFLSCLNLWPKIGNIISTLGFNSRKNRLSVLFSQCQIFVSL